MNTAPSQSSTLPTPLQAQFDRPSSGYGTNASEEMGEGIHVKPYVYMTGIVDAAGYALYTEGMVCDGDGDRDGGQRHGSVVVQ